MPTASILIRGSQSQATKDGVVYTSTYHVTGLPNAAFNLSAEGLVDPVSNLRIPFVNENGAAYGAPSGIVLKVNSLPWPSDSPTMMKVTVVAGPPEWGSSPDICVIDIGGASGSSPQQTDANGNPLVVSFYPKTVFNPTRDFTTDPIGTQYEPVNAPMPSRNCVITFTKTLPYCPLALNRQYRRTLNQNVWNGYPAGCVLCRDILGKSQQNGALYRTQFIFEAAPPVLNANKYQTPIPYGPWDYISQFVDAHTGQVPPEVTISILNFTNKLDGGYGAIAVQLPRTDFGALQLPSIPT